MNFIIRFSVGPYIHSYCATYLEQVWSWCSISCSRDSSCSVSCVKEFFWPIKVSNFDLSCESSRAIISSTALRISRTLSSLAARTDSTFLSCKASKGLQHSTCLIYSVYQHGVCLHCDVIRSSEWKPLTGHFNHPYKWKGFKSIHMVEWNAPHEHKLSCIIV